MLYFFQNAHAIHPPYANMFDGEKCQWSACENFRRKDTIHSHIANGRKQMETTPAIILYKYIKRRERDISAYMQR